MLYKTLTSYVRYALMLYNMKEVGVSEAQANLPSLLKELPFAITRYNKIIAIVVLPKEDKDFVKQDVGFIPAPIPSNVRKGFCNRHFERGIEYPLLEVAYQDINGIVGDYKWTCPSCIKSLEEEVKRNGGHIIIKNE